MTQQNIKQLHKRLQNKIPRKELAQLRKKVNKLCDMYGIEEDEENTINDKILLVIIYILLGITVIGYAYLFYLFMTNGLR